MNFYWKAVSEWYFPFYQSNMQSNSDHLLMHRHCLNAPTYFEVTLTVLLLLSQTIILLKLGLIRRNNLHNVQKWRKQAHQMSQNVVEQLHHLHLTNHFYHVGESQTKWNYFAVHLYGDQFAAVNVVNVSNCE